MYIFDTSYRFRYFSSLDIEIYENSNLMFLLLYYAPINNFRMSHIPVSFYIK